MNLNIPTNIEENITNSPLNLLAQQFSESGKILERDIYSDIRECFIINADNYLDDDNHWGNDVDFIYTEGKKLQYILNRKINIIYIGVGPGRILFDILTQRQFYDYIKCIDYSPRMIELTRKRLEELEEIDPGSTSACELELCDFLSQGLKPAYYDMALLLNNTLGNIIVDRSIQKGIETSLNSIRTSIRPKGILILSVYNADKFSVFNCHYTRDLKLISKLSPQDYLLKLEKKGVERLFVSHWFTKDELHKYLESAGFNVVRYEERRERIIISAQTVS